MIGKRAIYAKKLAWKRWNEFPNNGRDWVSVGYFKRGKVPAMLRLIEVDWYLRTGNEVMVISRKKYGHHRIHGWRKARARFLADAMKS